MFYRIPKNEQKAENIAFAVLVAAVLLPPIAVHVFQAL